jgi:hypothetical protein
VSTYAVVMNLVNLKAPSYGFSEPVYRPVGRTGNVFVIQLTTRRDAKTTVLWTRTQNEPCAPDFPVHATRVVCGTSKLQAERKMIERCLLVCFVFSKFR